MPYQLDYTDTTTGINYPLSFWIISNIYLNHLELNGVIIFKGYNSVNDYNVGYSPIAEKRFDFNSREDYESLLEFQFESFNTIFSFYALVEQAISELSDFFTGGDYIQWSIVRPISVEIGSELDSRVNVIYSGGNLTGISDGDGVSIGSFTITAADFPIGHTDRVYYDLNGIVLPGDIYYFQYDPTTGFMVDSQLLALHAFGGEITPIVGPIQITAIRINNTVGRHLKFNQRGNSGHVGGTI